MNKIRVVIIEDEFFAANHLKDILTAMGYYVDGVFYSGEEFLKHTKWNFDIAIVDIFLADTLSGIDIAEKLNEHLKPFIFLTANQDSHTLKKAASLSPKAYISKPFQQNDVQAALQIISQALMPKIQVRTLHGSEDVNSSDIIYIRSDGAYIEIQTINTKIIQRKLLKEILEKLPPTFIRVHRSYVINTGFIDQKTATQITLHGYSIPVSRSYKDNLDNEA